MLKKTYENYKEKYLTHLSDKKYSPHTITAYNKVITDFFTFFTSRENHNINDLTPLVVSEWLESIENLSSRTVAQYLSIMRSFFHHLLKKNIISSNVFEIFVAPKSKKIIPTTVSVQEMLDLLMDMPRDTVLERRNHCMLMMMYATGIRSEELCNLKRSDVDFRQNSLRVLGKGKKERIVPILDIMMSSIRKWLIDRKQLDKGISDTLFLSNNGRPLTTSMIRMIVQKEYRHNLQYIHPHAFRYTFATHLLNDNANLRHIQELLGHASLSTTQRYTKASISSLKQKYKKFHPRA